MAEAKEQELTRAGSHRATARGYAAGELIEEGQSVPADIPVSIEWMEPAKGSQKPTNDSEQPKAAAKQQNA